ncbi:MAG: hypothetical protein ABEK17_02620 [Candidatus Aenigmatarchaeota archaeon]
MNKKGVSLPVNVLVILAIAVVVLLGIVAFFAGGMDPTKESMNKQSVLDRCCATFAQMGGCTGNIKPSQITCQGSKGLESSWTKDKTLDEVAQEYAGSAEAACCQ